MIGPLFRWARQSRAVHDFAWTTAANILVKPAWFVFVTAACMRAFGAAGYGVFVSAIALASVFVILTEVGVSEYVMREVARDRGRAPELFSNLVLARAGLGLASVGLAIVFAALVGYERASWVAVGAAGLYALGLRVNELCRGLYRASDAFAHDAVWTLIERLATIATGLVALVWVGTPTAVLIGLAVGVGLVVVGNLGWVAWRHKALSLQWFRPSVVRTAYAASFAIGVFSLCAIVFHSAGPVLLAALVDDETAGLYGAAWRVVELYLLAPSLLTSVVTPRLASMAVQDGQPGFLRMVTQSGALLLAMTGALALLTGVLAEPLVRLLSGDADFAETVGLLRWLAAAFPLMSLSMLLSLALIASDRQGVAALTIGLTAVLHIVTCLVLIPTMGAEGVAIAMLGSYVVAVALGAWVLWRWPVPAFRPVPAA